MSISITTEHVSEMDSAALLAELERNERRRRRDYYEQLVLLREIQSRGVAVDLGYGATPGSATVRLAKDLLRLNTAEIRRRISHAHDLMENREMTGNPAESALVLAAGATAEGVIGSEHVQAIRKIMTTLPNGVEDHDSTQTVRTLLAAARNHEPLVVTKLGKELLARFSAHSTDVNAKRIGDGKNLIRLRRQSGGGIKFAGELDADGGRLLVNIVDLNGRLGALDRRGVEERRADELLAALREVAAARGKRDDALVAGSRAEIPRQRTESSGQTNRADTQAPPTSSGSRDRRHQRRFWFRRARLDTDPAKSRRPRE